MNPKEALVTGPPGTQVVQAEHRPASHKRSGAPGEAWRGWVLALVSLAALGLGIESLSQVDIQSIQANGLIAALPPGYFIALGVSLTGFVGTLGLQKAHPALLALEVLALVVILHGADPIIYGLPRLEASYRHLGITDYIVQAGHVDPKIDAYFNWPGFFAFLAMVSEATGVRDLSGVATWAPVGVNALLLLPLLALASRLTSNWRHAWASVWVFYLASWVGQDYLSPQACAFFLMVIFLACVLTSFGGWAWSGTGNRATRLLGRLVRVLDPAGPPQRGIRLPRHTMMVLQIAAAILIVAMTASHQLTPFALIPVLAVFLLTGRLRLRLLALAALVVPLAWLGIVAAPFWEGHINDLFGFVGAVGETTSQAVTNRISGDAQHLFVVGARLAETVFVLAMATIGAVIARRRGLPWLTAAIGAATPSVLYLLQPYGGELLLRLYLFGLPFAACLMVLPFMGKATLPIGWLRGASLLLLGCVLATTTLVTRYGNDAMENFTPSEISLVDQLYKSAPPGSVLIEAVHDTPWRAQQYANYEYQTLMSARAQPNDARLNCGTVEWLGRSAGAYLIVTQSQVQAADTLGVGPKGDVTKFLATCGVRTGWSVVYQNAGGVIYHIQGASNAK